MSNGGRGRVVQRVAGLLRAALTEAAFAATGTFCARRIQNSERAFQRS